MAARSQAPSARRVGIALSGGGHRAACWSAGAVLGLADAGVLEDVVSVSSVSGGSIANGVLAVGGELRGARADDVEEALRPGLRRWAHEGLFFQGPSTDGWVMTTLALAALVLAGVPTAIAASIGAGRGWTDATVGWITLVQGAVVLGLVVWLAATKLPSVKIGAAVLAGAALSVPVSYAAIAGATERAGWLLGVWPILVLALWVAVRRFGARSEAVVEALGEELFADAPRLQDLADRAVHHVFCATNLRTGNNLYLSNRLLWGHPIGGRAPGEETVASAVQASACLPGGFLARTLDLEGTDGSVRVVLSDGGVYDNMADQWELGFRNRQAYAADRPDRYPPDLLGLAQPAGATHLVVVNASRGMEGDDDTLEVQPGVLGEVRSLATAISVLYDVSTAPRRRLLIDEFERARAGQGGELGGMLVHIGTSPYTVVDGWKRQRGAIGTRARKAEALLDALTDELADATATPEARRAWWRDVLGRNAGVKTTLAPLEAIDAGSTARLLQHAWVLTRVTAHVVHGWGRLPAVLDDRWRPARFEAIVDAARAGAA